MSATRMHRLLLSSTQTAATHINSQTTRCIAVASTGRRYLSHTTHLLASGNKRDRGLPEARKGGIRLPDDDHVLDHTGRMKYKSARQEAREEHWEQKNLQMSGEGEWVDEDGKPVSPAEVVRHQEQLERAERIRAREIAAGGVGGVGGSGRGGGGKKGGDRDPSDGPQLDENGLIDGRTPEEFEHGSAADHAALAEAEKILGLKLREPMREQEQMYRSRTFKQAGIKTETGFLNDRAQQFAETKAKTAKSSANKHNPVLVRTRQHLNTVDLPASFDHFKVPPLSGEELDAKQKELHASYWSQYNAWKEARPDEHAKWLERLKQREMEQDYHWHKSQGMTPKNIEFLKSQETKRYLPTQEQRASFEQALKDDKDLSDAVAKLGKEEVLRRWSTYQTFVSAEIDAQNREQSKDRATMRKLNRDRSLHAEDTIETLNDPKLNLTLPQKKKLYHMMLGAKKRITEAPFWTDPDPRFEGQHDWKMADAFVKPPLLPPLHMLRHLSARPDIEMNFSSLHRFLHFERLRQTMHFLREAKKKETRIRKRAYIDIEPYCQELITKTGERWEYIKKEYPFLSDTLYAGMANLYRAPWAPSDQKDFITALHRNLLLIAKLLDTHFSRTNRKNAWILPFPNNPKRNPDEILRPLKPHEKKTMEARLLAEKMMDVLNEQDQANGTAPKSIPPPAIVQHTQESTQTTATAEK